MNSKGYPLDWCTDDHLCRCPRCYPQPPNGEDRQAWLKRTAKENAEKWEASALDMCLGCGLIFSTKIFKNCPDCFPEEIPSLEVCDGSFLYQAGEFLCVLCGAYCNQPKEHYKPIS